MILNMNYWIAVVDDDALSLMNAKEMLTKHGMRVNCLRSGQYFLKFIEHNTPDLVLLDVMMPETDGFETFRKLRELEDRSGRRHLPVIFLSGDNGSETEHHGLKIGAADYIRKPFDPDILLKRIQNAVSNSRIIENLTEEAEHDKLTGLLNKAWGTVKTAELCSTKNGALLLMDIDNFKLVNDIYGHETGDKVLAAFADTLRRNTRADDVVSRVGGDEFMAFFSDIREEKNAAAIVRRISEQFISEAKHIMGENCDVPIGISVGAALAPFHSADFDTLFQYADQTMYNVKKNGKHGFAMYERTARTENENEDLDKEISRITQIVEERGSRSGAMLLGQDSFSWNYRFIMRFIKRYKGEASKIIFSVSSVGDAAEMTETIEEFSSVLQKTLRISDIIMQNRANQFFLLLPELSENDVENVVGRILRSWEMKRSKEGLTIDYSSNTVSYKDEPDGG